MKKTAPALALALLLSGCAQEHQGQRPATAVVKVEEPPAVEKMSESELMQILYKTGWRTVSRYSEFSLDTRAADELSGRGSVRALEYFLKNGDAESVKRFVYRNYKRRNLYENHIVEIEGMMADEVMDGTWYRNSMHVCFGAASYGGMLRMLNKERAEKLADYLDANPPDNWRGSNCLQIVTDGLRGR